MKKFLSVNHEREEEQESNGGGNARTAAGFDHEVAGGRSEVDGVGARAEDTEKEDSESRGGSERVDASS